MKKKKKGFTLTELIIVIAIIAILAAVLIPSITGYVNKAKLSNDRVQASSMTTYLQTQSIFDDVEYYDVDEVQSKLATQGYDLTSSAKGYSFWYDRAKNQVVVAKTDDELSKAEDPNYRLSANGNSGENVRLDSSANKVSRNSIECLSSYHPTYQYIDQKKDSLTDMVETIRNLVKNNYDKDTNTVDVAKMEAQYKEVVAKVTKAYKDAGLASYLEQYDVNNAVYVDELGSYSGMTESGTVKAIIFAKDIKSIGVNKIESSVKLTVEFDIVIPSSVVDITGGSFFEKVNLAEGKKVYAYDLADTTSLESIKTLKDKVEVLTTSNSKLFDLTSGFEIAYTDYIVVYKDENGKMITQDNVKEADLIKYNNVVKVIAKPQVNILDKKNNGIIDFGKYKGCSAKIENKGDYYLYTAAVLCEEENYRISNIGYLNNVCLSSSTYLGVDNKKDVVKSDASITINKNVFSLLNYSDVKVLITYDVYNAEVKAEGSTFIDALYNKTVSLGEGTEKTYSINSLRELQSLNGVNISDKLLAGSTANSLKIKKIEFINKEKKIFIQYYN